MGLHLCIISSEYPCIRSGGIGSFSKNLGNALISVGARVTVLGLGNSIELVDDGITVRMLPSSPIPRMGWLLNRIALSCELKRMVREEQLTLIESADWCGLSAGIVAPCPIVVRCHGSATYFADELNTKVKWSVRTAEATALRMCDSVAAVGTYVGARTRKRFGLRDDVRVIPNGVPDAWFLENRTDDCRPGNLLYFGTIVRKKGVLDVAKMFSLLCAHPQNVRLTIVGRDSRDELTGATSTWTLVRGSLAADAAPRVQYLGELDSLGVASEIRKAEVCVFPSYAEAFPLAWLEAMAAGRPVVGYDGGWAREVIEPGVDGLLVPTGDVEGLATMVRQLLASPTLRERLGKAARAKVEREFTMRRNVERTLGWYEDTLRQGRERRKGR